MIKKIWLTKEQEKRFYRDLDISVRGEEEIELCKKEFLKKEYKEGRMKKIKENSKTNCPNCGVRKNGEYLGFCPECTYPEENN